MRSTPTELMRRWQTEGPRPRTLQAVLEWVAAALRSQRTDEAAKVLRELLALHEDPALWGYLAQVETAAGRHDKAAVALVNHIRLEPKPSPAVYVAAVDAFVEAGRNDRAKRLAELAPGAELKAFLLQRLRQDTGRAPKAKLLKTVKALAKLDRNVVTQILSNLPMETVAAAVGDGDEKLKDAVLDCFSGGPRRRLAGLMGREVEAKVRAEAKKVLLKAAAEVR